MIHESNFPNLKADRNRWLFNHFQRDKSYIISASTMFSAQYLSFFAGSLIFKRRSVFHSIFHSNLKFNKHIFLTSILVFVFCESLMKYNYHKMYQNKDFARLILNNHENKTWNEPQNDAKSGKSNDGNLEIKKPENNNWRINAFEIGVISGELAKYFENASEDLENHDSGANKLKPETVTTLYDIHIENMRNEISKLAFGCMYSHNLEDLHFKSLQSEHKPRKVSKKAVFRMRTDIAAKEKHLEDLLKSNSELEGSGKDFALSGVSLDSIGKNQFEFLLENYKDNFND